MIHEHDLRQFIGTENYYEEFLKLKITDGVQFLKENCRCSWLITDISIAYNHDEKIIQNRTENNFLLITLKINREKGTAILMIQEDEEKPILYLQQYEYTDIQQYYSGDEIKLYLIDNVLILPSEY